MQSASDMFLGWTNDSQDKFFYIRQLRDAKVKPVLEIMKAKNMADYAKACGWALLREHMPEQEIHQYCPDILGKGNEFANSNCKICYFVRQPKRMKITLKCLKQ
jgi:hypothetical protein